MISTPTKLYLIVVQVYHYCRILFNRKLEVLSVFNPIVAYK